jgi:hypothetical protein
MEKEILKNEKFGCAISDGLSTHLRSYTSNKDWADVSIKQQVSTSTIRDVIYRKNSLTENSSKAIIELVKIAKSNCDVIIDDANEALEDLNTIIEKSK